MKSENINIVKKFLKHQSKGELELALSYVSDDAAWYSDSIKAPWSGVHHGKAEIIKHFENIKASVRSFSKKTFDIVGSDSSPFVYEYGLLKCQFAHNLENFETYIISIYEIQDGKIKSYRVLENSLALHDSYHKLND